MAGADYKSCLRCGAKGVYDADWFERLGKDYERCQVLCESCRVLGYRLVVEHDPARGPGIEVAVDVNEQEAIPAERRRAMALACLLRPRIQGRPEELWRDVRDAIVALDGPTLELTDE